MRIMHAAIAAGILLAAEGCGGGSSPSNAAPVPTSPAPAAKAAKGSKTAKGSKAGGECALKQKRDIILRMVVPRLPVSAQVIGDVDYVQCRPSLDTLPDMSPTDPGYCTQAAYASDNPGYNADATPAARLKKVIVSVGPAC
jgi:hypothetical protein